MQRHKFGAVAGYIIVPVIIHLVIGQNIDSDSDKIISFTRNESGATTRQTLDLGADTAAAPSEFVRALIRVLDRRGYHNVAYAIMKCDNDTSESEEKKLEMSEFILLAKRLLRDSDQSKE